MNENTSSCPTFLKFFRCLLGRLSWLLNMKTRLAKLESQERTITLLYLPTRFSKYWFEYIINDRHPLFYLFVISTIFCKELPNETVEKPNLRGAQYAGIVDQSPKNSVKGNETDRQGLDRLSVAPRRSGSCRYCEPERTMSIVHPLSVWIVG